ncbi:uncharacterized protein HaLaN_01867, partial [Haematococcus lacustris]
MLDTQPLNGGAEPGAVVRSFLQQLPPAEPVLTPLVVGATAWAQRFDPLATELLPALKRPSLAMPPVAMASLQQLGELAMAGPNDGPLPYSAYQYMPRVIAYEPPAPPRVPQLPVLLYREFVELPVIEPTTADAIRAAIRAADQAAALIEEGQTRAVPHPDLRPEGAQLQEEEVLEQILALQVGARRVGERSAAAVAAAARSVAEADMEATTQAADAIAAAAAEAAAVEKQRKPWPPKVAPFDTTPKRPAEGGVLKYWEAEEGLVARTTDPLLRDNVVITRATLPPRLQPPLAARSAASPGLPSQ